MAPLSCQDKGHRTELKLIITTKYKNLDEKLIFFKGILNTSLNGKRKSLTNFPNIKLC